VQNIETEPVPVEQGERPEYNNGRLQYEISGVRRLFYTDAYYFLIAATWNQLLALAFGGYVTINLLFAFLYWLAGDGITGARPGSFADAFFFSVQTISTIGYGAMSPNIFYTQVLVTIESFIGLVAVAVGTGLIFAKFARPSARVAFSETMVVHTRDGVPTLQFRIANERKSSIINARLQAFVLIEEKTAEGQQMRRFHKLTLERENLPLFAISWLAIHRLDENSPLRDVNAANVHERMMLIIVSFEGMDETFLQTVQALRMYQPRAIVFDARFVDVMQTNKQGHLVLHHENLSRVEPLAPHADDAESHDIANADRVEVRRSV